MAAAAGGGGEGGAEALACAPLLLPPLPPLLHALARGNARCCRLLLAFGGAQQLVLLLPPLLLLVEVCLRGGLHGLGAVRSVAGIGVWRAAARVFLPERWSIANLLLPATTRKWVDEKAARLSGRPTQQYVRGMRHHRSGGGGSSVASDQVVVRVSLRVCFFFFTRFLLD